MGKDQDLLEAARTGDVVQIQKLLGTKKSEPTFLARFQRNANANYQDVNGSSPLHLAALNGHGDAVKALLKYEASANLVDNQGCCPLHLAAWGNRADICESLLSQGPSLARINAQNQDGDTALHSAAQYGHIQVVTVLLLHHADATVRNRKDESPLDLAAHYGRLDVVQLLLKKHPNLLCTYTSKDSPLHLAARNGHKDVVKHLILEGFPVNTRTDIGSALHGAAIFGKVEVVKVLLRAGIDPAITDKTNKTALQGLEQQTGILSKEIRKLISEYIQHRASQLHKRSSSDLLDLNSLDSSEDSVDYDDLPSPKKVDSSADNISDHSASSALYSRPAEKLNHSQESAHSQADPPPAQLPRDSYTEDSDDEPIYDVPIKTIPVPKAVSSPNVSGEPSLSSSPISTSSLDRSHIPSSKSPVPPKKPPRRKTKLGGADTSSILSSPSLSGAEDCSFSELQSRDESSCSISDKLASPNTQDKLNNNRLDNISGSQEHACNHTAPTTPAEHMDTQDEHINTAISNPLYMSGVELQSRPGQVTALSDQISSISITGDVCPALEAGVIIPTISCDTISGHSDHSSTHPDTGNAQPSDSCSTEVSKEPKQAKINNGLNDPTVDSSGSKEVFQALTKDVLLQDQIDFTPDSTSAVTEPNGTAVIMRQKEKNGTISSEEDRSSVFSDGNKSSRPPSLDFTSKRQSREGPLTPTGYQQPPTPDFPPPSPQTAGLSIQQTINPKDKRRSRDMETITESAYLEDPKADELCGPTDSNKGLQPPVILRTQPLDGSTSSSLEVLSSLDSGADPFIGLTRGSIPAGKRRVKSQLFENLIIQAGDPHNRKLKRLSVPGIFSFHPPEDQHEATQTNSGKAFAKGKVNMEEAAVEKKVEDELAGGAAAEETADITGKPTDGAASPTCPLPCAASTPGSSTAMDESDEWAQVAGILSSFGGRMSTSEFSDYDFERTLQQIFAQNKGRKIQSVGDWLESLGLPQYENILVAHGFDDMDFMGPNVLEEQDLIEMEISDAEHRKKILDASSQLKPLKPAEVQDASAPVDNWLDSLQLSEYTETFHKHNLRTMDRVSNLWELELTTVLDITALGHRKRMLASLAGQRLHSSQEDLKQAIEQSLQLGSFISPDGGDAAQQAAEDESDTLYRDYTSLHTHCRESLTPPNTPINGAFMYIPASSQPHSQAEEKLDIRPPNQAQQESPVTQWSHNPEVLIKGCCNYHSQYLGSTLVKELKGTESTEEAIHRIKESTDNIAKVPTVILSISYAGVKFIDARTKRVICEHEISNIFCACQDTDHLNFFAYITKDLQSRKHYCHVFSVKSMSLATEIILTLGEAFEIAYQLALREQGQSVTARQTEAEDQHGEREHQVTHL